MNTCKKKVIFLDRDGTIIKEKNYIKRPSQVEMFPTAIRGLLLLKKAGYRFIVISNQSAVARGLITEQELQKVNQHIRNLFRKHGITFAGIYCCPHHPEGIIKRYRKNCSCRKPKPGLLRQASQDFGINLKKTFIIGDSLRDLEAGKKVGARTILVLTGQGRKTLSKNKNLSVIDHISPNLFTAAQWIIEKSKNN